MVDEPWPRASVCVEAVNRSSHTVCDTVLCSRNIERSETVSRNVVFVDVIACFRLEVSVLDLSV